MNENKNKWLIDKRYQFLKKSVRLIVLSSFLTGLYLVWRVDTGIGWGLIAITMLAGYTRIRLFQFIESDREDRLVKAFGKKVSLSVKKHKVLIVLIGLMATWSNQPYFGWSYCVLQGAMRETDFIESIRPLIIRGAKGAVSLRNTDAYSPEWTQRVALADALHQVDKAFDLMKECVAKRGIKYCRYVGSDKDGAVNTQQDPNQIPDSERYRFQYIVNGSDVGMFILPWGDHYGSLLEVFDYKNNISHGSTVCSLGCDCNTSYNG